MSDRLLRLCMNLMIVACTIMALALMGSLFIYVTWLLFAR